MFRTFLVATRTASPDLAFQDMIGRTAQLYRARLVWAVVQSRGDLATPAIQARPNRVANPEESLADSGVQSVLLVGDFVSVVCDRGHEADVIVVRDDCFLGHDGRISAEETGRFARHAPRPVWLAREPLRFPEQILVAYDGSAHSGRALHMGANLAETLGARLTVLHVDESRDVAAQELILARAAGYCAPYQITLERVGVRGSAAPAIRDYAQSSQCDLLVVGAAGVGYVRGLLFGSVAGQLITSAPCSVLMAK